MSGKYSAVSSTGQKRCTFCGEVKPLSEFARNGVDKNGNPAYRQDCKVCYNIRRRENATKKRHSDFVGGMKRRGEEEVTYTLEDWKQVVIFFNGECAYCGKTPHKGERFTRDHLVPVKKGGATVPSNIVPCCAKCNSSKGAEEWRDWYMKQEFFSQDRMNKIYKWRTIMRSAGEE